MNRINILALFIIFLGCLWRPCPGEEIHQAAEKGDLARVRILKINLR
jgi:hypothetical protein